LNAFLAQVKGKLLENICSVCPKPFQTIAHKSSTMEAIIDNVVDDTVVSDVVEKHRLVVEVESHVSSWKKLRRVDMKT